MTLRTPNLSNDDLDRYEGTTTIKVIKCRSDRVLSSLTSLDPKVAQGREARRRRSFDSLMPHSDEIEQLRQLQAMNTDDDPDEHSGDSSKIEQPPSKEKASITLRAVKKLYKLFRPRMKMFLQ